MQKKDQIDRTQKAIIWVMIVALGVIAYMYVDKQEERRIRNPAFTIGRIVGKTSYGKGTPYIKYEFFLKGQRYEGTEPIQWCNECQSACCKPGTSVKIRYENDNPANNNLER